MTALPPESADPTADEVAPAAAVSYSWDNEDHIRWVREDLARRLRDPGGVNVSLDRWGLAPGRSLTQFMETLIRENKFILVVCTPNYKKRADARDGGVGFESDIIASAVFDGRMDETQVVPILRAGDARSAVPTFLRGRGYIDLREDPGTKVYEANFQRLVEFLHDYLEVPPPVAPRPFPRGPNYGTSGRPRAESPTPAFSPPAPTAGVRVIGIARNDIRPSAHNGPSRATFDIPVRLSVRPSPQWVQLFASTWDEAGGPGAASLSGRARVVDDVIVFTDTTIQEVRDEFRPVLDRVVAQVNANEPEREA